MSSFLNIIPLSSDEQCIVHEIAKIPLICKIMAGPAISIFEISFFKNRFFSKTKVFSN